MVDWKRNCRIGGLRDPAVFAPETGAVADSLGEEIVHGRLRAELDPERPPRFGLQEGQQVRDPDVASQLLPLAR